jgi:hypothetical protein
MASKSKQDWDDEDLIEDEDDISDEEDVNVSSAFFTTYFS